MSVTERPQNAQRSVAEVALAARIREHLRALTRFPDRHVGGPGNRAATALFAEQVAAQGFAVRVTEFPCTEWEWGDVELEVGGERFDALAGPYSLGLTAEAPLAVARKVEDLEDARIAGTVVLACGGLAAGQVMPKNFTFYNPESHKRIVRALEASGAIAVVAATGRDSQMVGSQYPFPLFEDGDLEIPNAYMKDIDGERLALHEGERVRLSIDSRRIPTTAEHVVATLSGSRPGRIVVTAHIDSRKGSPGALDNASGVAVLLALAELFQGRSEGFSVELVPFNGEDNYANPGEMMWVAENEDRFDDIVVGINIDDAGQVGTVNHVSFYQCPAEIEEAARAAMAAHTSTTGGPQWFQSDHAIFGIYGRPAVAIASSDIEGFMAKYAHSERDTIELADADLLAEAARFIRDFIGRLGT